MSGEKIDKYKLTLNRFSSELTEPLDRNSRTLLTIEADIYEVATQDNQDNTYNEIYKCKLVGSTIVKQGDKKPIICKSKRTQSQKMRQAIWVIDPNEEFYNIITDKIIVNLPEVIEFLRNK